MDIIKRAYKLAKEKHEGQMYGKHPYFDFHVLGVATNVQEILSTSEVEPYSKFGVKLVVVALLHDIVEDTEHTVEEIREVFGGDIADAVEAITKLDTENYGDYLDKVLGNSLATFVKIQDVRFNLEQVNKEISAGSKREKLFRLKPKYDRAIKYLMEGALL